MDTQVKILPSGIRTGSPPLLRKKDSIIKTGLIVYLNAADFSSYPEYGDKWYDLSANHLISTLVSNPLYSKVYGGEFLFNGSTQYSTFGNPTVAQITTGSISVWFNPATATSYRGILTKAFSYGLFLIDNILSTYDWGNSLARSTGISIVNRWCNATMTFTNIVGTPSNNAIIYYNGYPVLTTTIKYLASDMLVVGWNWGGNNQQFKGFISNAVVYNYVLKPEEVINNFNALRGKYGV